MSACVLCKRIAKIAVGTVDRGCTEAEAEAARIRLAQLKAVHDPDACAGRMRPFSGFFASAEAEDLWNEILRRTGEEVKAACVRWEAERNARTRQQAESDDWQRRTAKARRKRKKKDKSETLEEMFKRWAREAKREGRSTARDTNANRAAEFAREWERDPQGVESNQTELGKKYGLSAIAVGNLLKDAGLKDRTTGDATPRAVEEGFAVATPLKDGKPFFVWNVEKVGGLIAERHEPLSKVDFWVNEVMVDLKKINEAWEAGDDKAACVMLDLLYDAVPKDVAAEVRLRTEQFADTPPAASRPPIDEAIHAPWED